MTAEDFFWHLMILTSDFNGNRFSASDDINIRQNSMIPVFLLPIILASDKIQ